MIPKLITFLVAAQYIVLHNSYDEHSRQVVDQIPWNSSDRFCVIDWYRKPKERWHRTCICHYGQAFTGPPPSAFPEIVKQLDDGTWERIRLANSIDDRLDESKYERINQSEECLGGQWIWQVADTIRAERNSGEVSLARTIDKAYKAHLRKLQQLNVHGEILLPSRTAPSTSHNQAGSSSP